MNDEGEPPGITDDVVLVANTTHIIIPATIRQIATINNNMHMHFFWKMKMDNHNGLTTNNHNT